VQPDWRRAAAFTFGNLAVGKIADVRTVPTFFLIPLSPTGQRCLLWHKSRIDF
jgi:hypothetical protein